MLPRPERVIQVRADRVLRQAGVTGAPVDLDRVVATLGVEVRAESSKGDISGALYRLAEGTIIGVNSSHSTLRKRFTIAHECGHLVLHTLPVFIDRSFAAESEIGTQPQFFRSERSSAAIDPLEIEANRFAACLLMPRRFVLRDIATLQLPLREEAVSELAHKYDVSNQAMTFRLTNIGIPLDAA